MSSSLLRRGRANAFHCRHRPQRRRPGRGKRRCLASKCIEKLFNCTDSIQIYYRNILTRLAMETSLASSWRTRRKCWEATQKYRRESRESLKKGLYFRQTTTSSLSTSSTARTFNARRSQSYSTSTMERCLMRTMLSHLTTPKHWPASSLWSRTWSTLGLLITS